MTEPQKSANRVLTKTGVEEVLEKYSKHLLETGQVERVREFEPRESWFIVDAPDGSLSAALGYGLSGRGQESAQSARGESPKGSKTATGIENMRKQARVNMEKY